MGSRKDTNPNWKIYRGRLPARRIRSRISRIAVLSGGGFSEGKKEKGGRRGKLDSG